MSITPDEVRAATRAAPGAPPTETELPEAEVERIAQALNRHRSARTPTTTAAAAAPESQQDRQQN